MVRADYVAVKLVFLALLALQPPFGHSVSRVTAAQLPYSWHRGCPVAPAQLRRVRLTYWGFDRRAPTRAPAGNAPVVGDGVPGFPRPYTPEPKSPRLNSSHGYKPYAAFRLEKKKHHIHP